MFEEHESKNIENEKTIERVAARLAGGVIMVCPKCKERYRIYERHALTAEFCCIEDGHRIELEHESKK